MRDGGAVPVVKATQVVAVLVGVDVVVEASRLHQGEPIGFAEEVVAAGGREGPKRGPQGTIVASGSRRMRFDTGSP